MQGVGMKAQRNKWITYLMSFLLVIMLIVSAVPSAVMADTTGKSATVMSFTDIKSTHWAYGDIEKMVAKGIVSGYKKDIFKPDAKITRAEFAKIICLAAKLDMSKVDSNHFLDVLDDHWAFRYVEAAVAAGVITGYGDYTFRPEASITRAEIVTMTIKAGKYAINRSTTVPVDLSSSHWAYDYVMTAKALRIMDGYTDGIFAPNSSATRAESCKLVLRSLFEVLGEKTTNPEIPTIRITSPTTSEAYSTSNSSISLSGTASDNESVSAVTWVNSRSGSGTAVGTTSWSVSNIALLDGLNTITVTAVDKKNNKATDVIKVTKNTIGTKGTLSGTVEDSSTGTKLDGVKVSVYRNGSLVTTANTSSNGTYSVALDANSGYSITYSKANYLDYTHSSVTITINNTTTLSPKLAMITTGTLSGTIDETSTSTSTAIYLPDVAVKVYLNGVLKAETTTTGSGYYSITLTAANGYTVTFSKDGYHEVTKSFDIGPGQTQIMNVSLEAINVEPTYTILYV